MAFEARLLIRVARIAEQDIAEGQCAVLADGIGRRLEVGLVPLCPAIGGAVRADVLQGT